MGMAFEHEVDSETFAIETVYSGCGSVRVLTASGEGWWKITGKRARKSHGGIRKMGIAVSVSPEDDYLSVMITTQTVTTPLLTAGK